MKKMMLRTATSALALAITLSTISASVPAMTVEAAKASTATSNITSRVKAIPQVKANGGVLPTSVYDYNVYSQYADLRAAFGTNQAAYYNHFLTNGIKEGRTASNSFNVLDYKDAYADLQAAFGDDLVAYIVHFLSCGIAEGRTGVGSRFSGTYVAPAAGASQTVSQSAPAAAVSTSQGSFTKVGYSQMVKSLNKIAAVKLNGGKLPSSIYDYNVYGQYADLKAAFGNNKEAYYKHFLENGIYEGRTASANFNLKDYMNNNADLIAAFGSDAPAYINHYLTCGYKENRVTIGGGSVAAATVAVSTPAASNPAPSNPTPSQPSQPSQPGNPSTPVHTHSYTGKVTTSATCKDAGVKTYSCSCGDTYTESIAKTTTHNFNDGPTCTVCGTANPNYKEPAQESGRYEKEMAKETFDIINDYRIAAGVEPLVWDENIYAGAAIRAKEVVTLMDHKRPDGSDPKTVLAGLSGEYEYAGGEIITTSTDGVSAVTNWYNSAPHRSSMLYAKNYYAATATYYENGMYYSVTLFAYSTTQYRFDADVYTLDSWTLSDGSTITAREYDELQWTVKKLRAEYKQADGTYKFPNQEAKNEYYDMFDRASDALDAYYATGGKDK